MARPCTVCQNPAKATIDLKLLRGQTASSIAKEHNIHLDSLLRHKANHLKKSSDGSPTLAMMNQVIAELDHAATLALAQDDIRACVDARKRKADLVQALLLQESSEAKAPTKNDGSRGLDYLDTVVARILKTHDECPLCHQHTLPKPSGNSTGRRLN